MVDSKCIVCSLPNNVLRKGLNVCRACADFFNTTMRTGRKQTCRFQCLKSKLADFDVCTFRKHEKLLCSSCRFDQCIKQGMKYVARKKNKTKMGREKEAREVQVTPAPDRCQLSNHYRGGHPNISAMDTWKCLVCSVPITATSFGMDVCRACTMFFKRTMQGGRTYSCRFRQLRNQCIFRRDEIFMLRCWRSCRSCRLDQCIKIGMEYVPKKKNKTKKEMEEEAREFQEMLPSMSSMFLLSTPTRRKTMLETMKDVYKNSHKRRLVQEHKFIEASNLNDMGHPTKELYLINITQYYEVLRIRMQDSRRILGSVFDEFDNLSVHHRTTLLRNFIGRFWFTEGLFLSARYFKDRFYFMTSLLTCMDPSNVDEWVPEQHEIEWKDELRTSVKGYTEDYNELLAPMLKMSEWTETELYALLVLAYCDLNPDLPLPEEVIEKAEKTRLKVFGELQDYYRNELQLINFSGRLGNLMTVVHQAGEAGVKMNEEMRMYATMFNLYPDDELFREVFLY